MKHIRNLGLVLLLAVGLQSCTTTQRTITFNSLYTVQHVTSDTYDGYVDAVIQKKLPPDDFQKIGSMFNIFQVNYLLALDAAQFNTNALAPSSLITEGQDIMNAITVTRNKGHK